MTIVHSPETADKILAQVEKIIGASKDAPEKLTLIWNTLAYMQAFVIAKAVQNQIGIKVYAGPFKGMELSPHVLAGTFGPHLLGTYENELHSYFEEAIQKPYQHILNIGCSFGYYTVGFALRMPHIKIEAFDIVESEKKRCLEMAKLNKVADRITISGEFHSEDFAKYEGEKTLLIMDIEGGEIALLDPQKAPALKKMDVIVELHDLINPATTKIIYERFKDTHDIKIVRNTAKLFDFSPLVGEDFYMDSFDSFTVAWENRSGPTPWGIMIAKSN